MTRQCTAHDVREFTNAAGRRVLKCILCGGTGAPSEPTLDPERIRAGGQRSVSREEVAAMYDGPRPAGVTHEYVPPTPAEVAIYERSVTVEHGMMGGPMKMQRIVRGQSSEPPRLDEAVADCHARMEAVIFERGGHVAGEIRIVPDPTVREGEMRATAYPAARGSSYEVAAAIRGMLPPISELVTPKVKALTEKWGGHVSSACEDAGCELPRGHAGMHKGNPFAEDDRFTPTAMLGEAAALLKQAMDAIQAAGGFDGSNLASDWVVAARNIVMLAKRDAEARSLREGCTVEGLHKPGANSDETSQK